MQDGNENSEIWCSIYEKGNNDIRIPNDIFVRIVSRYVDFDKDSRVCDVGMGTGANLLYLCNEFGRRGVPSYACTGVEVSAIAIEIAESRFSVNGLAAQFVQIVPNQKLPFPDESFDVVISWQVLYYNDANSFKTNVDELNRILAHGGLFISATAAPGDVSSQVSELIGIDTYRSKVKGQEGAIMYIPPLDNLSKVFVEEDTLFGHFGYELDALESRHWIVIYRKGLGLAEWNGH